MQLTNNLKKSPLHLAKESNDPKVLAKLASSFDILVRRAVARNPHTSSDILSLLSYDPVMNVSFMASSNPNCSDQREFSDTLNPCISCKQDERDISCLDCTKLNSFYKDK